MAALARSMLFRKLFQSNSLAAAKKQEGTITIAVTKYSASFWIHVNYSCVIRCRIGFLRNAAA